MLIIILPRVVSLILNSNGLSELLDVLIIILPRVVSFILTINGLGE